MTASHSKTSSSPFASPRTRSKRQALEARADAFDATHNAPAMGQAATSSAESGTPVDTPTARTATPSRRRFDQGLSCSVGQPDLDRLEDIKHRLYLDQRVRLGTSQVLRMALAIVAAMDTETLSTTYGRWDDGA